MMAVALPRGTTRPAQPRRLFEGEFMRGTMDSPNYDIMPDGQRFVMVQRPGRSRRSPRSTCSSTGSPRSHRPEAAAGARLDGRDKGKRLLHGVHRCKKGVDIASHGGRRLPIASRVSRLTCARVTPFTPSSADRTAAMQPSHAMPSMARVAVAIAGASGGAVDRCASRHAPARAQHQQTPHVASRNPFVLSSDDGGGDPSASAAAISGPAGATRQRSIPPFTSALRPIGRVRPSPWQVYRSRRARPADEQADDAEADRARR